MISFSKLSQKLIFGQDTCSVEWHFNLTVLIIKPKNIYKQEFLSCVKSFLKQDYLRIMDIWLFQNDMCYLKNDGYSS